MKTTHDPKAEPPRRHGAATREATHALDRDGLGDHLDRLYRAAWALCGDREEAEDLVQETYVRVLSRPRLLRKEGDLGYLLGALRNTFLDARRALARRPPPDALPLDDRLADHRHSAGPEAAFAATGTLALRSGTGRPRLPSLSVETHVALVTPDQFYADWAAWLEAQGVEATAAGLGDASNTVLVSGPSRTGDIEMTLTVGVHGPREVIVVIVA